ncbi:hypothetical protein BXZ70DRAFT_703200 [Cristinia sonorae]|uniref:Uncharacterized protein n=1 Tax=Cristinia sonorae TaxID=1940300 RepID=A0A8K0UFI0_9AGAR|nr:hypothetical protein BXZ70DRAFT_703200 [Cristinia sonorae]
MVLVYQIEAYVMTATCGAYFWDFITSVDFDWSFVTRRKKLTWPMIPYYVGRILGLATVLAVIIHFCLSDFSLTDPCYTLINHERLAAIVFFTTIGSYATVALASTNLAIRAMALWSLDVKIVAPLAILLLGQWMAIILNVIFVGRSFYALQQDSDPSQPTALRHSATYIPLVFVYTAVFDTVIFTLTLLKLLYPWTKRGCLVERMLKDGTAYFLFGVSVNIPVVVIVVSTPNSVINNAIHFPTAIFSLMVANRLVRRLSNFTATTPSIYIMTANLQFADGPVPPGNPLPVHPSPAMASSDSIISSSNLGQWYSPSSSRTVINRPNSEIKVSPV